jgi:protein SCO1/2
VQSSDSSPASLIRTLVATVVVLLFGIWLFLTSTFQGQALTTEALRQVELNESPKKIPALAVVDSTNQESEIAKLSSDKRVLIVDFIYTRCQTVCLSLGSVFQVLQTKIIELGLENQIGLVSISFDPTHDDAEALQRYEKRLQMQPNIWRAYSLKNPNDRQSLLDAFGIMVIPAPLDEFEHNAALHIIRGEYLLRIFPLDSAEEALLQAVALGKYKN